MNNAYKKFGYFYDEIMACVNYDLWLEFTTTFLKKGDSVLDLACGTGTFCTILTLNGYHADGIDLSETSIEIAKEKKKLNRMDINYTVCDMTKFKTKKKYDVITCYFDSMNFLSSKKLIQRMLKCVAKSLKKGGFFLCDIFSKEMLKEYTNNEMHEDYETFKIDWYTKKINDNTLHHDITIHDGNEDIKETYDEYYYEIEDLKNRYLKLIQKSGDFNNDLQDQDERILLVFQRK